MQSWTIQKLLNWITEYFTEQLSATTDSSGVAVITTTTQVKRPSYGFCVDSVSYGSLTYESNDNVEGCDSN